MPCAAGSLCILKPDHTPGPPLFTNHKCRICGSYLHGLCGLPDPEGANEMHRVCYGCVISNNRKESSTDPRASMDALETWVGVEEDADVAGAVVADLKDDLCELDTRHSLSGAIVMLAKGEISWHSRMQEVTASGTSESEYAALSEVVTKALLLKQVQDFMKPLIMIGAVDVFEDNEGAMKLAVNKHASRSTKHIDMKHHLVRDAWDAGKVGLMHIKAETQHQDLFTNPLGMQKFYKHTKTTLNKV